MRSSVVRRVTLRLAEGSGKIPSRLQHFPLRRQRQPDSFGTAARRCYHELSFQETSKSVLDVLQYHSLKGDIPASVPVTKVTSCNDDSSSSSSSTGSRLVRVAFEYAPWNPADLNTVQGTYGSPYTTKPEKLAAKLLQQSEHVPGSTIVGSEGWGQVVEIADNNNNNQHGTTTSAVKVGDWVTVGQPGVGTMRSFAWLPETCLLPVPNADGLIERQQQNGAAQASTLFQLGGTAIRMLSDFCELKPGSIVLQNAGNSGVGFMISQLAALAFDDVTMVSLVRRGTKSPEQFAELSQHLTHQGKSNFVVAEEDLENNEFMQHFKNQLKSCCSSDSTGPVLALNAVGGSSSQILCSLLGPHGTHVTYGGMSRQPVTVGTANLIFKDLRFFGYWHSRWMVQQQKNALKKGGEQQHQDRRMEMVQQLVELATRSDPLRRLVCPPIQVFPLSDYRKAIEYDGLQSNQPVRSKIVFDCREH